jgi:hypothetical protein
MIEDSRHIDRSRSLQIALAYQGAEVFDRCASTGRRLTNNYPEPPRAPMQHLRAIDGLRAIKRNVCIVSGKLAALVRATGLVSEANILARRKLAQLSCARDVRKSRYG